MPSINRCPVRTGSSTAVLTAAVELALPAGCPGCGATSRVLCPPCASAWAGEPRQVHPPVRGPAPVPAVWAGPDYRDVVARTLVAWKERGRLDLTPVLAAVLAEVIRAALAGWRDALSRTGTPVLVVPAPSSRGAVRRRGEDVVRELTLSAVGLVRRGEAGAGPALRVAPVLRQRRGVRDQAGLSAAERWWNLRSGLRVVAPARRLLPGRSVVLVDDVVTTGATTAAATRTLRAYAANVPVICAIAVTPSRGALAGPRSLD